MKHLKSMPYTNDMLHATMKFLTQLFQESSGPGCSKLTMSLVNVSLKFQMLKSEMCHYILLLHKSRAKSL